MRRNRASTSTAPRQPVAAVPAADVAPVVVVPQQPATRLRLLPLGPQAVVGVAVVVAAMAADAAVPRSIPRQLVAVRLRRLALPPVAGAGGGGGGGRGGNAPPTGRGGSQDREWYRGIPIPPGAAAVFTRRVNTNYMETGVLSALQLTSMIPNIVVQNFYVKSRNSIEEGKTKAPFGFVIPVQRDMTKAAELVNILRIQGIEIGIATADIKIGDITYPAGSYVIKRDQPYGRLAKNLSRGRSSPMRA